MQKAAAVEFDSENDFAVNDAYDMRRFVKLLVLLIAS
jgi:hypothetical protein